MTRFKTSFMTFGCPEWTFDEVLEKAAFHGYDGIEWREESNHRHGVEHDLPADERARRKRQIEEAGLESCCLATSRRYNFRDRQKRQDQIELTKRDLELAAGIGAPGLRVFGGQPDEDQGPEEAVEILTDALSTIAPLAAEHGVQVWLETHDFFRRGALVGQVVERVNSPLVKANYDVMHPVRVGESLEETFAALDGKVGHTHFHDCGEGEGGSGICPFGEGLLPLDEFLAFLSQQAFSGYLSGEWFADNLGADPDTSLKTYLTGLRELLQRGGYE